MMHQELPAGTTLRNRYLVVRMVSDEGGMARVYEVLDTHDRPHSRWAMKELRPGTGSDEHQELLKLFNQEAELLRKLNHRNVPRYHDRFDETGRSCLVLEFIDGQPLDRLLSRRGSPMKEQEVLAIAVQLCQVLHYLHTRTPPIIYRDLKPGNIMITRDSTVKVIDFGIARTYKGGKRRDTQLMGTQAYAAPEQYGIAQSDARTDIYALGATMYHLLTNQYPPHAKLPGSATPVHRLNPAVSQKVSDLVSKAMQKDRDLRFQAANEMETALKDCLGLVPTWQPRPQPPPQPPKTCPDCHQVCRATARFCSRCGHSFAGLLPAVIRVIQPYGVRWEMPVRTQTPFIIGKATIGGGRPDMDLSFYDADGWVSRKHAEISVQGTKYMITDLDSTNGTLVNNQRLRPRVPRVLRSGDRIQLGRVILLFQLT